LLSGKFPDYENLIPQKFNHSIIIKKETMLDVIKRISSISQDNIPVKLELDKGKITASMNIREVGSAVEEFEVVYGEENLQIAFNPDFLIDGLNIMDGEKFVFNIVESLKPVMIKPENNENLVYLLMPIRIS
jgi:DNA polymerase-3 subunit beta